MSTGYLDGIPFVRYDSERGRMKPLTQWMENGVEPEHWERKTQTCEARRHVETRNLETARERYNQSRGEWGDLCSWNGNCRAGVEIDGAGMGSVGLR